MTSKRVANSFTRDEIERSNETRVLCRSDAYRRLRRKFLAMDTRLLSLEAGKVEH